MMVLLVMFPISMVSVEEDEDLEQAFSLSLEELLKVKVRTAARVPESIRDIPAGVVLVTREDIETYGYMSLEEILENIPGLYGIDDYAEKGPAFGVRGFWAGALNDNMTLMKVNSMYHLPSFNTPTLLSTTMYLKEGDHVSTRAFFVQAVYRLLDKLSIVAGMRLEQVPAYSLGARLAQGTEFFSSIEGIFDYEKIAFIPRLAVIYSLNEKHVFKFLYGTAINRPSFFQDVNNLYTPGADPLEPEEIHTVEVNYIGAFGRDFLLNISLFHNSLDKLISRVSLLDENGDYYSWSANAGGMNTRGVEVTVNAEPFDNVRLELSGTYQETTDERPEYKTIDVAYSPKFLGYFKASYRTERLALAVTGTYVGAMETFWDDSIINPDGSRGARIGERTPGYLLMGANVRWEKLFGSGLFLNLRCSNLLDAEVRYPTYTNNAWADRGTLGHRRRFLLTLGYKF